MLSRSERFLYRLQTIVEENISDQGFGVRILSEKMGMSKAQLWRKVKQLTQLSPVEFIRATRLSHASQMLKEDVASVAEIARSVGFNNRSYFARCFHEHFGTTPSRYAKSQGGKA